MDILKLDTQSACDESIDVELRSPVDNKPTNVFFTIVGKDSKICQDFSRNQIDDLLRKSHWARQRNKDVELQTSKNLKDREIEFLVACTVGWYCKINDQIDDDKPFERKETITFGSEELVYSKENVRKLFKRLPWIATQIDEDVGNIALFMKT